MTTRPNAAGRFPRRGPRYTLALGLAALAVGIAVAQWQYAQMSDVERHYLPAYLRSAAAPLIGLQTGTYQILSGQSHIYRHDSFHEFLQAAVYGQSLLNLLKIPALTALFVFICGLFWSVPRDIRRARERRQGRRNKGPELVSNREFNRRTKGDGLRIVQDR